MDHVIDRDQAAAQITARLPAWTASGLNPDRSPGGTRPHPGLSRWWLASGNESHISVSLRASSIGGESVSMGPEAMLAGTAYYGRPPNCQLCTSMSAYRSGVRMARAVSGSGARISAAVPSQVVSSSDSRGP